MVYIVYTIVCEILQAGSNEGLVKKIVKWAESEHSGIIGESSRLLTWIGKNCGKDTVVVETLVRNGALLPMVNMMESEHTVMVSIQ